MAEPITLTWHGDDELSEDLRAALTGPGAPFERRAEPVLGAPTEVFVQRAPNVPALLERAARRAPDDPYLVSTALVSHGDEAETLTFAQVLRLAGAYAEVLVGRYGVGKGDRVAIAAPNRADHVVAWWAALSLGAIVVGLNGWWTPAELEHGLRLTGPRVVFGEGRPLTRLAETAAVTEGRVAMASLTELGREAAALPDPPSLLRGVEIDEDDPAAILFTSGTTGKPKGATLSHRNIVHFGLYGSLGGAVVALTDGRAAREVPPGAQRSALLSSPLFHVSGACVALANGTTLGMKLVLPPPGRWDEETALRLTHEHRLTHWGGVPTHFWRILTHPRFESYDTAQVATIGCGGATFAPELLRLVAERMPGLRLTNGYGMTETTGMGTLLNGRRLDDHPASVGAAAPTIALQVRDPEGRPLPEGEVGEIHVSGAGVFLGYWNDPGATAEALTADRWYRSGDYGRIVDGVLYLESRIRDLIIRGGENIYPIEIENRLVEHPDIADACVIGVPHTVLGQEVKAVVVTAPGASLTGPQVRDWAAAELAAFKVPAHVEFRTALPYSETGKVVKRLLETDAGGR